MNELKMNSTGIYPNYLNSASSVDILHYPNNSPSAEFVDLSFVANTFLVIEQPIEINRKNITGSKLPHVIELEVHTD